MPSLRPWPGPCSHGGSAQAGGQAGGGEWIPRKAGPRGTPGGVGESGWCPETCRRLWPWPRGCRAAQAGRCQEGKEQTGRDLLASQSQQLGLFSCRCSDDSDETVRWDGAEAGVRAGRGGAPWERIPGPAMPCGTFPRSAPQYLILVLLVGKEAPGGDHGYETRKGQGRALSLCSLLYGRAHTLESGSRVRHQD